MIAGDVITRARYTLSDADKSRWSDARLLSLLNDALLDMALTTRLYSSVGFVKIQKNIFIYSLSSFAIKVNRVEHLSNTLEKVTFDDMDELFQPNQANQHYYSLFNSSTGGKWQDKTSDTPTHLIYDLKRNAEFRLYPIPTIGGNDFVTTNSNFGIITSFNYENLDVQVLDTLGGITEPNLAEYLKVYYIKIPKKITALSDTLDPVIDRTMIPSLAHYVSGFALRDNLDAQNRQVGNEHLNFYGAGKSDLAGHKSINSVKKIRTAKYRGME